MNEKRISELATGLALNELTSEEMNELYEYLRQPDESGEDASRIAWQAVRSTIDIRATTSTRFEDTVEHLLSSDNTESPDGFLTSMAVRLGIARPALDSVSLPAQRAKVSVSWRRVALWLASLTVVLLLGLWLLESYKISVASVQGSVLYEGKSVRSGDNVKPRPIILSAGSRLSLRWPGGHTAIIQGPANIVPHSKGLSLSSGIAKITSAGSFSIGLPDGLLRTEYAGVCHIQIQDNRSIVASESGVFKYSSIDAKSYLIVLQGQAAIQGSEVFKWIHKEFPLQAKGDVSLDLTTVYPIWNVSASVVWNNPADKIILLNGAKPIVEFTPGAVHIVSASGEIKTHKLSGPPMLERAFSLEWSKNHPLGQWVIMNVQGLSEPIIMPAGSVPNQVVIQNQAKLTDIAAIAGPQAVR